jgi:serine/threonine protein kinase/tetratricopeptide (TPR) repeat protein
MNVDLERHLSLFEAASEFTDPAQRSAFLNRECGGNTALLRKIEKLASASDRAEGFFAGAIPSPTSIAAALQLRETTFAGNLTIAEPAAIGATVGSYKLVEKIGEGGCGIVYLAEQTVPVRRRVALKVIKLGMDTRSVIARFEAERQALAMMEHPNIARVLDAGATGNGRPYFVMELVSGTRITDYCDQNRLPVSERLRLFIQSCHAIQHAHQKGIIHRDIKPSNILVAVQDGEPVPKVIDFGIAKATEERLTDKTLFTAYAQLVGTPAYMSPEQVALGGMDLDTRSDIYSLGVLLYELLAGKTPFDTRELMKSGVDEMRRTLREREPCRPSARLHTLGGDELTRTAGHRHIEPPQLFSQLRGDLDWIVMKALEKDRTRRYETADALATDVQRYLDNEPILARPPSRWYQFRKLVRRNRIVVLSGAAVAAALLAGTVVSTSLYLKERAAERMQAEMRDQAEAREQLTQAVLLAARSQYADSEKLLDTLNPGTPSMRGINLMRTLGAWHATNGEWAQAAARYQSVIRFDQFDSVPNVTMDYSGLAAALIASGDAPAYDQFREAALAHFKGVSDPALERILKGNLLSPASQQMMKDLQPYVAIAANSCAKLLNGSHTDNNRAAWSAISLALYDYRSGDYSKAADWCQRSLATPRLNPAGIATANILLAMSCWHMDQKALALSQWSTGEVLIQGKFQHGLATGNGDVGYWYDWVIARALSQECQQLFATGSPAAGSSLQPSKDTSATWRALGEWHALRGQWQQSAECYASALRLGRFDGWKDAGADQISCAVVLAEAGDTAGYETFREQEIARFKPTDAIFVADINVKSCLLRPAGPELLAALAPAVKTASGPFTGEWNPTLLQYYDAWRSVSVALYEFRSGNYPKAIWWSRHCLDCPEEVPARTATARVILAMALHQAGDDDAAHSELQQARNVIDARFATPLDHGIAERGLWYEWLFARSLLREGTTLLATPSQH